MTTIPIIVFDCTLTVYFVSSKENKILVPKKDTVKLALFMTAQRDHDKMKYYAEEIQKFERQLRLPVSDFSNILEEKTKNDPDSSELNNGGYGNQ